MSVAKQHLPLAAWVKPPSASSHCLEHVCLLVRRKFRPDLPPIISGKFNNHGNRIRLMSEYVPEYWVPVLSSDEGGPPLHPGKQDGALKRPCTITKMHPYESRRMSKTFVQQHEKYVPERVLLFSDTAESQFAMAQTGLTKKQLAFSFSRP